MKIGINGATGQLGKLVVEQLKERIQAENIIALVRTPEKAKELGGEIRAFDYNDSDALPSQLEGIDYTILRNGWYTENYTASIEGVIAGGAFIGAAASGKISSAARIDYAEAAAVVLLSDLYKGKVFELAGDEAYTLSELAAELSNQTGKDLPYRNLQEEEYAKILESFRGCH